MSLPIVITPGHDLRLPTPVRIPIPAAKVPLGAIVLRTAAGRPIPAQQLEGDVIVAVLSGLPAGEPTRFTLEAGEESPPSVVVAEAEERLTLRLPEGDLGEYHFGRQWARPFLHPVCGPGGIPVTRAYPMVPDAPGESRDHPHHKSLWTAYGEVNDTDDWSEGEGHGYIRHREFLSRASGPVCGGFRAAAVWTAADGAPVLDEERVLQLYNAGPDCRLFDYDLTLTATYGEVHFGDTKEGGLLSVRVATSMDGKQGGRIENSEGGVGEAQCWGRPASWCDYSGEAQGAPVGIAVLDHPGNLRHPTRWHVRDYGLMTTNSFAEGAFEGGQTDGYRLAARGVLRFRYRVLIHRGDATAGGVPEAYASFESPPISAVG